MFSHLFDNLSFLLVFLATLSVHYLLVQYGGRLARCAPLTSDQHAFCLLIGASSLVACVLLKLLPDSINEKLPRIIDERKPQSEKDSRVMQFYKKQAEAKVVEKKKSKGGNSRVRKEFK